jgi:tripartite-type tricarboxylate transporter receptor subunit TctC
MMKRKAAGYLITSFVLVFWVLFVAGAVTAADKYPSRPVTTITLFGPGGVSDLDARIFSKFLEKYLGGTFVVDHKPGGGGVIGITYVANSKPDGYTLLNSGDYFTPVLNGTATYKMEDLRVVAQVIINGCVLAVAADAPWKTWQEFSDYAKKNPGVKWAHQGVGTMVYFRTENLNRQVGLKLIGLPLKGDAEIITALLGKNATIGSLSTTSAKVQADAGKLRIILSFDPPAEFGLDPSLASMAVTYPKVPDLDVGIYVTVPAKTPNDVVDALEKALEKASKDPEYIKAIRDLNQMVSFVPGKTVMEKKIPMKMGLVKTMLQEADAKK